MKIALAPNAVFPSIQGEGRLTGEQMIFVRLAGCSVGCPGCDTDYSKKESIEISSLVNRVTTFKRHGYNQWVWITGGEPTDHGKKLEILIEELKAKDFKIALATSGCRTAPALVDWLSVSPHSIKPSEFGQREGQEVKLIEGLNDLNPYDWAYEWDLKCDFQHRYIQPQSTFNKNKNKWIQDPTSLKRCFTFLEEFPYWSLSEQRHHEWGVQ